MSLAHMHIGPGYILVEFAITAVPILATFAIAGAIIYAFKKWIKQ